MTTRRIVAKRIRNEAAEVADLRPRALQTANADESTHRSAAAPHGLNYIGTFSKGLEHDPAHFDEVRPERFRELMRALTAQSPDAFEAISLGVPLANRRKFVNPQAGLAFELEGPDAGALTLPPAPRLDSAELASEMAELYWMALLRDVSFTDFGTNAGTDAGADRSTHAAQSLSAFSDFRGPKDAGNVVTPTTLFRGFTPGDRIGPYVSQFLLKPVQFGTLRCSQRQRTAKPGIDYLIDLAEWRDIQNGKKPTKTDDFDPTRRYIRNPRDLATYVHFDALYEAYLNACLILLQMEAPVDPGNPYFDSMTQDGFATFGGPHILSLVTEVATRALKAVWHQKWFVHRRLRPEAFGGLVHHQIKKNPSDPQYPIHADLLNTTAAGGVLDRINTRNVAKGADTFLLPQAFPEGSPLHPAYGAGHATVAGACVTILKAWFDESTVFDPANAPTPALQDLWTPKVPNAAGTALLNAPPSGPLTVGGELNKVAANVAIGRNMAGVHWRTDYTESVKLGEAVAIGILEEQKLCLNERHTFTLTRFDGTSITI